MSPSVREALLKFAADIRNVRAFSHREAEKLYLEAGEPLLAAVRAEYQPLVEAVREISEMSPAYHNTPDVTDAASTRDAFYRVRNIARRVLASLPESS